jgi:LPXTG-motif cell wall-anchored protein
MKKSLAAIALAGLIALTGTAPAVAATYPAPPPQAAVSDGFVGPGEEFTFSGNGFLANEPLTIAVTLGANPASTGASIAGGPGTSVPGLLPLAPSTIAAQADSTGAFSVRMSINEPGSYVLTATGNTSGRVSNPVRVTVAPGLANSGTVVSSTGTPLANTGADASLLLWGAAGVAALGLGAASVITVRRRAKATETNA